MEIAALWILGGVVLVVVGLLWWALKLSAEADKDRIMSQVAWNAAADERLRIDAELEKASLEEMERRRAESWAKIQQQIRDRRSRYALIRWRASKGDGFNNRIELRRANFDMFVRLWVDRGNDGEYYSTDPVRLFGIEPYLKRTARTTGGGRP